MSSLYRIELREDGWAVLTAADGKLVKGGIEFQTTAALLMISLERDADDFADRY